MSGVRHQITEKKISEAELVTEAQKIWANFRQDGKSTMTREERLQRIRAAHEDFMNAHYIIGYYIAIMGWFAVSAVKKYAQHIVTHPWHKLEDMVESQAIYGMYLHRKMNPRGTLAESHEVKRNLKKCLLEEYESQAQMLEQVREQSIIFDKQSAEKRRLETEQYCALHGREIVDIPLRALLPETSIGLPDENRRPSVATHAAYETPVTADELLA